MTRGRSLRERLAGLVQRGALLAALGLLLHLIFYAGCVVVEPGVAAPASELVRVAGGAPQGGGRGSLLYTTVSAGRAGLVGALRALADPGVELRPLRGEVPPGLGWEEYTELLRESMRESRAVAVLVALRHLGYRVSPGEEPPVDVEPAGDEIGGESAALVVALEVYRQLTGAEVAGGLVVAGTGALLPDGRVEAVGGVRQKVLAAERAGADVFLVPRANAAEAAAAARRVRIVPVDTFEQAVGVLQSADREEYPRLRGI